jgi:glyoxylase-like metal-dependent hydrolase (beta-lactamase superfamily II)
MNVSEIARDVYVLTGQMYSSNSVVIAADEGVILVDAMAGHEDVEDLRRFVADDLGKPVRYLVSTHYFGDHTAGLKAFPDAQIIAHVSYAQTAALWDDKAGMERDFVPASILVSSQMTLRWGRYVVEIFHNPGHTMSTLNIDVEGADLLVVGDTAVGNIASLRHADPELLPVALRKAKERGRSRVVSGHSGVKSIQSLDNAMQYCDRLVAMAQSGEASPEITAYANEEVVFSEVERFVHQLNIDFMKSGGIKRFIREPGSK